VGAVAAVAPLLSVRDLTRRFGGLTAVDRVDFELAEGEVRAIIGPNGAGKTTFVGMICGRIAPSAGAIRFDGSDITAMPAHARVLAGIAYTFQITSVFANLSVAENVALAVQRRHVGGKGGRLSPRAFAAEIDGFIALVREIAGATTVLLIEHNMPVVMALAGRITVMDQGRIIAEGTPDEMRANAAVQAAYLGAPADA
jgi:branched-chain amino acid transport system ATP-binding protein